MPRTFTVGQMEPLIEVVAPTSQNTIEQNWITLHIFRKLQSESTGAVAMSMVNDMFKTVDKSKTRTALKTVSCACAVSTPRMLTQPTRYACRTSAD
jgi:hypothetical protein